MSKDRIKHLENSFIKASFDAPGLSLQSLANKLTGETYALSGDAFTIETTAFRVEQNDTRLAKQVIGADEILLIYEHPDVSVSVRYTLGEGRHFIEKQIALTCPQPAALTRVSLGQLDFKGNLQVVCYKYPDFDYYDDMPNHQLVTFKRPKNTEPLKTYFGRTAQGGFFTGLEMPFDTSTAAGKVVELSFAPNLRLKAGEEFASDPAYLGVYRLGKNEPRADQWKLAPPNPEAYDGGFRGSIDAGLPTPGEIKGDLALPRACVVFGPLAKDDPRLSPDKLNSVPKAIEIGGRRITGQSREFDAQRELDLRDLLSAPGHDERLAIGLTAYVFIPFDAPKSGPLTFGLGADWWYEAWLDGKMISETVSSKKGNVWHPPTILNFTASAEVIAGRHLLVVRFIRGLGSAKLAVGGPADLRDGLQRIENEREKKARARAHKSLTYPLPAESAAMVAMTSAVLGKPRHGLMATACSWHCQMEHEAYTPESLEADLKTLDFYKECGLDVVADSHPWGGETEKMTKLREGDHYEIGAMPRRFLERARELGLKITQWPTMTNTHPWVSSGKPFRLDRPEWLRGVAEGALDGVNLDKFQQRMANCLACAPYYEWLERLIIGDALGTGLYESWCMDGDFWGTGAYYTTTIPVTCTAENHSHLPPDSNFACQRALNRLIANVRQRYPDMYIVMARPAMDLGVWSNRNVDVCFTLVETGGGASNLVSADEIRTVSRVRVHRHFFPHWLDWPYLFPSYGRPVGPPWPSEHIDYVMLSALSSSPNPLLNLPARTGIPERDKAEIRKWLDWGRQNEKYLLVRKDLPDWPAPGKVDGSAHIVADQGLIFLFNSAKVPLTGEFSLTEESIGLQGEGTFGVTQEYPQSNLTVKAASGQTIKWEVPTQTAVILRLKKTA